MRKPRRRDESRRTDAKKNANVLRFFFAFVLRDSLALRCTSRFESRLRHRFELVEQLDELVGRLLDVRDELDRLVARHRRVQGGGAEDQRVHPAADVVPQRAGGVGVGRGSVIARRADDNRRRENPKSECRNSKRAEVTGRRRDEGRRARPVRIHFVSASLRAAFARLPRLRLRHHVLIGLTDDRRRRAPRGASPP